MATFKQEQNALNELHKVLNALNAIKPESLVRTDELGKDLNFEAGLPVFQRTLGLFRELSECNLETVPFPILNLLRQWAGQTLTRFQAIQNFSPVQCSEPANVRDELILQLEDNWSSLYEKVTPHISYATRRGTDFGRLEREARGTLEFLNQQKAEFQKTTDKILTDMQGALKQVQQAAAEAGVAQHAIHFKTEAEFHKKQSCIWLIATIFLGFVIIGCALLDLLTQLNDFSATTIPRAIQLIVPRLVVIFVLTFGFVWAARNYAASRHNFVVNRHRQNALSSFETFVKSTSDPHTKDAVLLQATQSIFSPQDSGFVRNENLPNLGSQIIEVVRGVAGGKP